MIEGLVYGDGGVLEGAGGRRWRRVRDWVDPLEADRLVGDGVPLVVQWRGSGPVAWWSERYARDVRVGMLTRAEARRYAKRDVVPQVLVGEVWRGDHSGDLLLFVERPPVPRGDGELSARVKAGAFV